jgi:hypothetical protein
MDDFESRLREFRPRRPAAIPDQRLQLLRGPIWVAVAAGIAAVMLIATWMKTPSTDQPAGDTATLTTLALERPDEFDAALARISRASLPDVTQPGGALHQLAKF